MDFELDNRSTKVESDNCEAKNRLQDESMNCSLTELALPSTTNFDTLPSMKLTDDKVEGKSSKVDDIPEMDMARHHYPTSYRYPVPDKFPSHVGARYEVQGGKVVLHRN